MACEAVAETELPISRQSVADLTSRARKALGKPISSSTVWRMLHEDAIKPWQYEHWIFPRDPLFAEKAGRVLDLYAGSGALGLESLSRGALRAVFVDNGPAAVEAIKKNAAALGFQTACEIIPTHVKEWLKRPSRAPCSTWQPGTCIAAS